VVCTKHVEKCGVVGARTGGTYSKNLTKLNFNTISTGVKLSVASPLCIRLKFKYTYIMHSDNNEPLSLLSRPDPWCEPGDKHVTNLSHVCDSRHAVYTNILRHKARKCKYALALYLAPRKEGVWGSVRTAPRSSEVNTDHGEWAALWPGCNLDSILLGRFTAYFKCRIYFSF
jgi:hypothetical protein